MLICKGYHQSPNKVKKKAKDYCVLKEIPVKMSDLDPELEMARGEDDYYLNMTGHNGTVNSFMYGLSLVCLLS